MNIRWKKITAILLSATLLCGTVSVSAEEKHGQTESKNIETTETVTITDSGKSGDLDWTIDSDGVLTISGTGDYELENSDMRDAHPVWCYKEGIKKVVLDVSSITSCKNMFWKMVDMTEIEIRNFDTSQVTDMSGMFFCCESLTSLDISGLDTSQVTDMSEMFWFCSSLTSLNLSGIDASQVTNMRNMFGECSSLTSLNLSGIDTSQVTDMSNMFWFCSSLTSLDLSSLDTSQVTDMSGMFGECSSLTSLDLSSLDTSQVTDMASMFRGCSSLTSLDLRGLDTSQVTNILSMFSGCSSLTSLNLQGMDLRNVEFGENIDELVFNGCFSLEEIYTPKNVQGEIKLANIDENQYNWVNNAGTHYTTISSENAGGQYLRRIPTPLQIRVGDTEIVKDGEVTGENYEGISYNAATNTLKFENADIRMDSLDEESIIRISGNGDENFEIQIEGNNTITCPSTFEGTVIKGYNLSFSGSGTLNMQNENNGTGIEGNNIEVENCRLNLEYNGSTKYHDPEYGDCQGGYTGINAKSDFTMESGNIEIIGKKVCNFSGIRCSDNFNITEGNLHIAATSLEEHKYQGTARMVGITGSDDVYGEQISIKNGKVKIDFMDEQERQFLMCDKLIIQDSTLECNSNKVRENYSGISFFEIEDENNLNIWVENDEGKAEKKNVSDIFKQDDTIAPDIWFSSMWTEHNKKIKIVHEDNKVITGDLDGDGNINIMDMMQSLNYVSKKGQLTDEQFAAADINGDGRVNLTDLMLLLNYISKKSSTL